MFRIMSVATLVMIAICLFVGASIAFADGIPAARTSAPSGHQLSDASVPVRDRIEESLAAVSEPDEYDFSDYAAGRIAIPVVDAERIEEPNLDRLDTIGI